MCLQCKMIYRDDGARCTAADRRTARAAHTRALSQRDEVISHRASRQSRRWKYRTETESFVDRSGSVGCIAVWRHACACVCGEHTGSFMEKSQRMQASKVAASMTPQRRQPNRRSSSNNERIKVNPKAIDCRTRTPTHKRKLKVLMHL